MKGLVIVTNTFVIFLKLQELKKNFFITHVVLKSNVFGFLTIIIMWRQYFFISI